MSDPTPTATPPQQPWYRSTGFYWLLLSIGVILLLGGLAVQSTVYGGPGESATPADLTAVMEQIEDGKVERAGYVDSTGTLTVLTKDGKTLTVTLPTGYVEKATSAVVDAGIPLEVARLAGATKSTSAPAAPDVPGTETGTSSERSILAPEAHPVADAITTTLYGLGILTVLTAVVLLLMRRRENRAAEAEAKVEEEERTEIPGTRFKDVAGCEEAMEDLKEMVEFLKDPRHFERLGATIPKGALLCGPPGTGKTLLARAVAGEAGVTFHSVSGSDFVEQYVGVGAKRVRDLFTKARKGRAAIVFIDEIDAIARKRSNGEQSGANQEQENTLIALLTEMDGFKSSNVIVLAATNRPDILDPALTRPGRLDRRVEVPLPDRRGREEILRVHTTGRPVDQDVDLTRLARRTPGFSGAQLQALVNEACIEAVRRRRNTVDLGCFDSAVATVAMGRARQSALVTEHDRKVTAWHEAGHTLAALLTEADDPVQVSIVPRGPAGGVTWMSGSDDLFLARTKAKAQLVVAMGGRVAEEMLLEGEHTQGASGDLQAATQQATAMVAAYGMTELGLMVRTQNSGEVEKAVEKLLQDAYVEATALLAAHREYLEKVAEALLEHEDLTLEDVKALGEGIEPTRVVPTIPEPVEELPPPAPEGSLPIPVQRRNVLLTRLRRRPAPQVVEAE